MAIAIRGGMGVASLILIAGSLVLMFLVVLSGVANNSALNKIYFLQADTASIVGAPRDISQWTYFYVCSTDNQNCGSPVPALPIGYAWVGGTSGAPPGLVGHYAKGTTSKYYYYMWRFGWVFYLMSLIFNVLAFFTSLLAPCSRLASGVSGFVLANALFWFTLAASLMTTAFVRARNEFHKAGLAASVGHYAFGFTWAAWAAMFLAMIFLFLGCGLGGRNETSRRSRPTIPFFRRRRQVSRHSSGRLSRNGSRRSIRHSYIDTESQPRVKDEF